MRALILALMLPGPALACAVAEGCILDVLTLPPSEAEVAACARLVQADHARVCVRDLAGPEGVRLVPAGEAGPLCGHEGATPNGCMVTQALRAE